MQRAGMLESCRRHINQLSHNSRFSFFKKSNEHVMNEDRIRREVTKEREGGRRG